MNFRNDNQSMLYSVYHNNARYVKGIEEASRFRKIVEAMSIIDRCFFVPKSLQKECYIDSPLPIGYNVTISQPTTVARMLFLANIKKGNSILEIGSGSGWNASLIASLAENGKIASIERVKMLSLLARKNFENFKKISKSNKAKKMEVDFVFGDAMNHRGKIWKEKYDRIMLTAGVSDEFLQEVRKMGIKLLNENGLLVFPREDAHGSMEVWAKKTLGNRRISGAPKTRKFSSEGKLVSVFRESGYAFVPLTKGRA